MPLHALCLWGCVVVVVPPPVSNKLHESVLALRWVQVMEMQARGNSAREPGLPTVVNPIETVEYRRTSALRAEVCIRWPPARTHTPCIGDAVQLNWGVRLIGVGAALGCGGGGFAGLACLTPR